MGYADEFTPLGQFLQVLKSIEIQLGHAELWFHYIIVNQYTMKNLPHPQQLALWYKVVNIECTQSIYFLYMHRDELHSTRQSLMLQSQIIGQQYSRVYGSICATYVYAQPQAPDLPSGCSACINTQKEAKVRVTFRLYIACSYLYFNQPYISHSTARSLSGITCQAK